MKKDYLNRLIIIGYLAFLCFHYLIGRKHNIFPSFVFPAFSQAPRIETNMQYPDVSLYVRTTKHTLRLLKKEDFFNGYKKHVNYFLNTIIANEKKHDASLHSARNAFLTYSSNRLKKMYPHQRFEALVIVKSIKRYNTKTMTFKSDLPDGPATVLYLKK